MELKAEVAIEVNCKLGEGPVWDEANGCLRFVDILGKKIFSFFPDSNELKQDTTEQLPSAMVPIDANRYLIALKNGLYVYDVQRSAFSYLIHPDQPVPGNRYNDGKCDPQGRFWIGSMDHGEEEASGTLYMINHDLSYEERINNTEISNGIAWDVAQNLFYHIDTPKMEVVCYDYDPRSGVIDNARVVIKIGEDEGSPDGMTIDTDGMLWIAHFGGGKVSRRNPKTGEVLLEIPLPVQQVTCCTFGGEKYEDLYITTASKSLSEEELRQQPLAGNTFVVKNSGYKGFAPYPFQLNGL